MSVSFKRIEIWSGAEGAPAQAGAWLSGLDAGAHPERGPVGEPPVAAWIGSPSVLEALGLRGDLEVTGERLASAIEGRNVQDGRVVRAPAQAVAGGTGSARDTEADGAILAFEWRPPKSVSRLGPREGRDRRAAIDQALLAGVEASLEELRRTAPLVERRLPDGAIVKEPARGVAAVAIVRQTTAGLDQQQVSVHTLILGVEDAAGKVVIARGGSQLDHDVASEVDAAGGYTLAWELTRLGYSVDSSERGSELFNVATAAELLLSAIGEDDWNPGPGERSSLDRAGWATEYPYVDMVRDRLLGAWEDFLVLEGREGRRPHLLEESELADQISHVHDLEMELAELSDMTGSEARRDETVTSPLGPERLALSVSDPVDELDVLGEQRRRTCVARMEPLAEWLQEMPDAWVAVRHAELGPPTTHLDPRAARLTRLIESRREVVEEELREALETGTSFDVRGLERKLADVRHQEQQLWEEGLHVDQNLDSDAVVRSAAYSMEYATRREFVRQLDRSRAEFSETARVRRDDVGPERSGGPSERLAADSLEGLDLSH